jgi:hypothetical protein
MLRRSLFALLAAIALPAVNATEAQSTESARKAAADWLRLVDSGDATGSWEQAAASFKRSLTSQQWAQAYAAVRAPLGATKQRQDLSAQFTRTLPGVADGQYVVLQFQTSFENKTAAVETATVALDADGSWRVAGYFIK